MPPHGFLECGGSMKDRSPRGVTAPARSLRALGAVRVDGVVEGVHVDLLGLVLAPLVHGGEARPVLGAALAAAGPVPVVLVRGRRDARGAEEGVRGVADAGLVHGAGARGRELAGAARVGLAFEGPVLALGGRIANGLWRGP